MVILRLEVKRATDTFQGRVARLNNHLKEYPMTKFINKFAKDESGATAIEYGLIAALIAVVIITTVSLLGTTIAAKFQAVVNGMNGV